jgi:hypothetical protein
MMHRTGNNFKPRLNDLDLNYPHGFQSVKTYSLRMGDDGEEA